MLTPTQKAWRFLRLLAQPRLARKLGTLVTDGYLAETGWVRSVLTRRIVDREGSPVPWMTRPFIDFIGPRLRPEFFLFEYGSGASTLFFARRVREIVSVEHDAAFAAELRPQLPPNCRVVVQPAESVDYIDSIARVSPRPHVVVVDGLDRPGCARAALSHIDDAGIVILDDSQLEEYGAIYATMKNAGFRPLDFWGLAAGRVEHRCTTVFYRSSNVLGI